MLSNEDGACEVILYSIGPPPVMAPVEHVQRHASQQGHRHGPLPEVGDHPAVARYELPIRGVFIGVGGGRSRQEAEDKMIPNTNITTTKIVTIKVNPRSKIPYSSRTYMEPFCVAAVRTRLVSITAVCTRTR